MQGRRNLHPPVMSASVNSSMKVWIYVNLDERGTTHQPYGTKPHSCCLVQSDRPTACHCSPCHFCSLHSFTAKPHPFTRPVLATKGYLLTKRLASRLRPSRKKEWKQRVTGSLEQVCSTSVARGDIKNEKTYFNPFLGKAEIECRRNFVEFWAVCLRTHR